MASKFALIGLWSDTNTWASTDGGAGGVGKPGTGDAVLFTINSGAVTLDENTAAIGLLDMDGYTNTLIDSGSRTLDIEGFVRFAGTISGSMAITCAGNMTVVFGTIFTGVTSITFDASSGDVLLTPNGVTLPPLIINNAGVTSFTAQDAIAAESFTLTAGKYDDGGFDHNIGGDIILVAAGLTSTGKWTQTATGNISSGGSAGTRRFAHLVLAPSGVVSTLTDFVDCKELTTGPGTVVESGSQTLLVRHFAGDFFTQIGGDITINLLEFRGNSVSQAGSIDISSDIQVRTIVAAATLDWQGKLKTSGTLAVAGVGIGHKLTLVATGGLDTGIISIGSGTRLGKVDFVGSIHRIGGLTIPSVGNNDVDLGSAYIEITGGGTMNFANAQIVANTACDITFGTISNVSSFSPVQPIYCHDVTDGGGNNADDVKFDETAPRGVGMLMGVGG